jgi:hypothetical protein
LGNVKCTWREKVHEWFWWRIAKERDHLEDLGMETRMMLMSIHKIWGVGLGVD